MGAIKTARHPSLISRLSTAWSGMDAPLRRRLVATYAVILGANIVAWTALGFAGARYPILLGLAPVAFGFGLRHAVDPDHIAAIDNTTRKLMSQGQRPVGVGLFFSLGHSTVVFALSIAIAFSADLVRTKLPHLQSLGGLIGTAISGVFLIVIAAINFVVLLEIVRTWRKVSRGDGHTPETLDALLNQRGLLARLFRPVLAMVGSSWQMYFVGLLFGLGFDTASEVGILGMSATAGAGGMPVWLILLLPLIFVCGMSLVDTTDGVAMLGAYGWAQIRPVRKLYYNMNITLMSILVALFIGGIEVLQVVGSETGSHAGPVSWADAIPFNNLGFFIIGAFLLAWAASVIVFKVRRIDRIDDRLAQQSSGVIAGGE